MDHANPGGNGPQHSKERRRRGRPLQRLRSAAGSSTETVLVQGLAIESSAIGGSYWSGTWACLSNGSPRFQWHAGYLQRTHAVVCRSASSCNCLDSCARAGQGTNSIGERICAWVLNPDPAAEPRGSCVPSTDGPAGAAFVEFGACIASANATSLECTPGVPQGECATATNIAGVGETACLPAGAQVAEAFSADEIASLPPGCLQAPDEADSFDEAPCVEIVNLYWEALGCSDCGPVHHLAAPYTATCTAPETQEACEALNPLDATDAAPTPAAAAAAAASPSDSSTERGSTASADAADPTCADVVGSQSSCFRAGMPQGWALGGGAVGAVTVVSAPLL